MSTFFSISKTTSLFVALAALTIACNGNTSQQKEQAPVTTATKTATDASIRLDSTVLLQDLAFLSSPSLEGREVGSEGNKKAREYIAHRFDSLGLLPTDSGRFQSFSFKSVKGVNTLGIIKGTVTPEKYYVLSAHYDHLGVQNGKVYPGADDNASGSACLLALASWFKQHPPKHSILFASFDAEEKGLQGSKYFVDHSWIPVKDILLNINLDMLSRNDKNEIYVCGTTPYPYLKKYTDSVLSKTTVKLLAGHDDDSQGADQNWISQSDHFPFHLKKIPFLYFGVEDHPDYHRPGDTFEKINPAFYYAVCNLVAEIAVLTDRQETLNK